LLFLARCVMGVQFESIGALGPLLKLEGFDYGQLGILIGAYLAPGFLVALPGGLLMQKIGDRSTILLCLLLMAAGALLELDSRWIPRIFARILSGTGGVVLTVAATKMIVDRFTEKELATAMAVFVNSWPCGIALSLICLPPMSQTLGLPYASISVALAALTMLAVTVGVLPRQASSQRFFSYALPSATTTGSVCVAATIWGIANGAFATMFGFGPLLLSENGYSANTAASQVSVVLWVTILAIPIGGMIAGRLKRDSILIVACLLVAAGLMLAVARGGTNVALFIGIGIISGLPGAAIMSLPSRVLEAPARAIGMGLFYSVYYGVMLIFPAVQGALARNAGSAEVTFNAAAISLFAALPLLAVFVALARRSNQSLTAA
jgi:MFS family permease